ncbi:MAG: flavodoxin domain-containing protein [Candidatus Krumholzibacteriota bacterium]|nr:flavodoxin domain-containing protein [Candidatus Krumholzibacteriota bacterium]
MKEIFRAIPVTEHVWWVGAIDWDIRDFHGYSTHRGSTYNAYLVMADRVTLIDTVKKPFRDEMMARIASVTDPSGIDTIVSNHSEMDHSGCLVETVRAIGPERLYASAKGAEAIEEHFHAGLPVEAVSDGGSIDLGNMSLTCVETRMLHWPDSMVSWLDADRVLFSQDGFGMHLASCERFDDQIPDLVLEQEAAKYFANILLPFAHITGKVLDRIESLGLDIDVIAPDHGPVWRSKIDRILALYRRWAGRERKRKAVILYDTMWGSTQTMARAVADGLSSNGACVRIMSARGTHRSDIATEILDAGALVVGSPTLNNTIFPALADILTYLKGLKPKGLVGGAFGSYGWSGEAVKLLEGWLDEMKVEKAAEGVRVKYVPDTEALLGCRALGAAVAKRIADLPPMVEGVV